MNSNRIFTKRVMYLDSRVWLTMLMVSLLSLLLLSYTIATRSDCSPFEISIVNKTLSQDSVYYVSDNIIFEANSRNKNITWTFSDKPREIKKGEFVTHKFTVKGKFYVSASINGQCPTGIWLTIEEKPNKTDDAIEVRSSIKQIRGESSTFIDKNEIFVSPVMADSFYEWVVVGHGEMGVQRNETANFTFKNSGKYTIRLAVDRNRSKTYFKEIYVEGIAKLDVNVKPQPEKGAEDAYLKRLQEIKVEQVKKEKEEQEKAALAEEKKKQEVEEKKVIADAPKIIRIGDKLFKSELQQLVEEKRSEEDFYKYLCGKGSTPVNINSKSDKSRTFSQMCKELKGKRSKSLVVFKGGSIKIKSVKLIRDDNNKDCISLIEVEY